MATSSAASIRAVEDRADVPGRDQALDTHESRRAVERIGADHVELRSGDADDAGRCGDRQVATRRDGAEQHAVDSHHPAGDDVAGRRPAHRQDHGGDWRSGRSRHGRHGLGADHVGGGEGLAVDLEEGRERRRLVIGDDVVPAQLGEPICQRDRRVVAQDVPEADAQQVERVAIHHLSLGIPSTRWATSPRWISCEPP
jgi:hypothetical protein